MDTRAHGYFSHGTMPESGKTEPEWEAISEEYETLIHGILDAIPESEWSLEPVEYDALVAQIMYWHRDVRWLHPGEFDEQELILQAVESY